MFLPIIFIVSSITINIAICSDRQINDSYPVESRLACPCPGKVDARISCPCYTNRKRDYAEMDCECTNEQEHCVCSKDLPALMRLIRNYSDLQHKPMRTPMHKNSNTNMFFQKLFQRVKNDAGPTPILYLLKIDE